MLCPLSYGDSGWSVYARNRRVVAQLQTSPSGCRDSERVSSEGWLPALWRTIDDYAMKEPRRWICFDEPDEAYLAAAALRRYGDGSIDAVLIPSDRGPAIDIAREALSDPLVRALVRRFSGRPEDPPADDGQITAPDPAGPIPAPPDDSPGASKRLHSSLM